jgi:hypothetical protein
VGGGVLGLIAIARSNAPAASRPVLLHEEDAVVVVGSARPGLSATAAR